MSPYINPSVIFLIATLISLILQFILSKKLQYRVLILH